MLTIVNRGLEGGKVIADKGGMGGGKTPLNMSDIICEQSLSVNNKINPFYMKVTTKINPLYKGSQLNLFLFFMKWFIITGLVGDVL